MGRLNLLPEKQAPLLQRIENRLRRDANGMAAICDVHPRTYRDWRRGKYKIPSQSMEGLCTRSGVGMPQVEVLPDFWSTKKAGRLGALARYRLYGNPGTPAGRRKAGLLMKRRLEENPDLLRKWGLVTAKNIRRPAPSPLLAEFIGVLLGDGGVRSRFQATISYNRSVETGYAGWLQRMGSRLFGVRGTLHPEKKNKGGTLLFSSVEMVEYLRECAGLKPGNKLRNGIDIPQWVWAKRSLQTACLRGLMDTDGGPFVHRYRVNGKWYGYRKLCFYSGSPELRSSVCRLFRNLSFHPRLARDGKIFIDRQDEVRRFYRVIGSRQARHYQLMRTEPPGALSVHENSPSGGLAEIWPIAAHC